MRRETQDRPRADDLAPANQQDAVIEAFKKDVDRTLLRENLKLTVEQRLRKAESFHRSLDAWQAAGRKHREEAERVGQV